MDSDEEQLQIVSYNEPEAYAAASHSENRIGIKMTPKISKGSTPIWWPT